jgi:hypothetical protein
MKSGFFLIVAICSLTLACKPKAAYKEYQDGHTISVVSVSLSDSLSPRVFRAMDVADVRGIRVIDHTRNNRETRYFEYEGDIDLVTRAISQTGFSIYSKLADASFHAIDLDSLHESAASIEPYEKQVSFFFWDAADEDCIILETLKGDVRHTIVAKTNSRKIFHRIEIS